MALKTTGPTAAWVLGLLAVVPFLVGSAIYCWGWEILEGATSRGLLLYSAVILSFMAGSRWGNEIGRSPPRWLVLAPAIATPLIALILSMSMTELSLTWRFGGFIAAFLALWLWDTVSTELPGWYPGLRTAMTVIACASLGLALESSLHL